MRMSASMCLILMEMTGAPGTLPFLMMVLVVAKGVGDRFNHRCAKGADRPQYVIPSFRAWTFGGGLARSGRHTAGVVASE